eukprot:1705648-Amphidinium_carterae.1
MHSYGANSLRDFAPKRMEDLMRKMLVETSCIQTSSSRVQVGVIGNPNSGTEGKSKAKWNWLRHLHAF